MVMPVLLFNLTKECKVNYPTTPYARFHSQVQPKHKSSPAYSANKPCPTARPGAAVLKASVHFGSVGARHAYSLFPVDLEHFQGIRINNTPFYNLP
jgi:hypothetical protein